MNPNDRDLLRILAEIARELGAFREHLGRIEAVQCRLFELLEQQRYPRTVAGKIEVTN